MRTACSLLCLALLLSRLCAAPSPMDKDLAAHWTFDEGSGDVARDVTGHGHDAALKNVDWIVSPRGHALRFDSRDDLADYADVDSMILTGDITLAVWVKTDSSQAPKTTRLLFGDTGMGIERNMTLYLDSYGYLRFEWADGTKNAALLAPGTVLNGTWKHVVITADSQARQAIMYVDGAPVARVLMPLPISKAPVKLRQTGWFYNGFFTGDLDDIRLYSRALTQAEVQQLFESQADLQIGASRLLLDASAPEPSGTISVSLRNFGHEPRTVQMPPLGEQPARELVVKPGITLDVPLGAVNVKRVWSRRNDLLVCEAPAETPRVDVTTRLGDTLDVQPLSLAPKLVLEPLRVHVTDPWQKAMKPGQTTRVAMDIVFAIPAEQLRQGSLTVRLVSRETGQEVWRQQFKSPQSHLPLSIDVRALPWGAYDAVLSFANGAAREVVTTKALVTILPAGKEQVRVLNNLVSELSDARSRGLLGNRHISFMNPRDGWVWFRAAGNCSLRLAEATDDLLVAHDSQPPVEAMRLLPAGKHVLLTSGTPTDVTIRAIPGLFYNVYPAQSMIAPFGPHDWQRLAKYMLPNTNMIEAQVVDTPEQREWTQQGKLWIANIQAPGLLDKIDWTPEKMLEVWLNPGKTTAWPERPGYDLDKFSGVQIDEYDASMSSLLVTTAQSVAMLAEAPAFKGKMWIPFVGRMYGTDPAELFYKATVGAGWPFSIEVYLGEEPTEQRDAETISSQFVSVADSWNSAYPDAIRHAIFTPMYAYLPYCTTNCYPQADFRVHLDTQMQLLATDPSYFALWGVQPYRSNYVDPEILDTMGLLLRHYCIEGKTDRMMTDPYELRHVANPDFAEGSKQWQVAPAEEGSITAGQFKGYGIIQGRYPGGDFGDTFLIAKRSAKGPNIFSQELKELKPGKLYSLKLITGDYGDLQAGKSRKDQQAISIKLDGAQVQEGGFSYPFYNARGPQQFSGENRFWMTYHWLQFRAQGPTATLTISDWAKPGEAGGPIGQQIMYNFVEVQPVLER